jgi:ABC-type Fe3+ transport system substrate-binding protein
MLKRGIIVLALAAVLAVPFILRPRQASPAGADDTLILISPNNEEIRHEFSVGFRRWYHEKTGRTVFLDWRNVGGTSDITRYLDGQYDSSFRYLWTSKMGKPWSAEIQAGYKRGRLPADAPAIVKEAHDAFRQSDAGCGMDVFFGGGPYDFEQEAAAGRLLDAGLTASHPDWFTAAAFPQKFNGEFYRDPGNLWFGAVMSSFGILYNKDSLKRIGFDREPDQWADLADPRFLGQIGLCDPTESGSILVAFENVIQQLIQEKLDALRTANPAGDPKAQTAAAVREGWIDGLRLIQLIGANARYFTDTSQKPPIDVATGDCAAGMCIDFYGREQQEAVRRRNAYDRLGYAAPEGGSSYSVDPIALLRGAPHRAVAVAFMEYVLSLEGQRLWNFRAGTPGGPELFALRRLPVRRDFYGRSDWLQYRSDPRADPYSQKLILIHHDEWTGMLFGELAFIIRIMEIDTHADLTRAWKAILEAPEPRRARALAVLQDLSAVDYDSARGRITASYVSKNRVDQVELARDLGGLFRSNYRRAERIAQGLE